MNDFIKKNTWGILLAAAAIIGSYYMYGYRITALEDRVSANEVTIKTSEVISQEIKISLAKMEKDIEYIKLKLDKIAP